MSSTVRVFLLKDVQKLGMAKEIVKVSEGYADNFLLPKKLAVKVDTSNEKFFEQRKRVIQKREEVIATETTMLADHIRSLKLTLRRKMHDDGKLYGSINPSEIAELVVAQAAKEGHRVAVDKRHIKLDKSIKSKGSYEITVKLSMRLQPKVTLTVIPE